MGTTVMKKILFITSFVVFFGPVMAMNASAALVATINQGNSDLVNAGYAGPFANVYITLDSSTQATVKFESLNGYLLGDGNIAALNVNASSFQSSLASSFTAGGSPGWTGGNGSTKITKATYGGANVSDFGSFNLVYDSHDGFNCAVTSLTFTLTNTSGSIWTSESNVLSWNTGYGAAAHIFTADGNVTGFAAAVPLPSTMLLLGSGLAGLVGIGRWRRRK